MPAPQKPFTLEECDIIRRDHAAWIGIRTIVEHLNGLESNEERKRNNWCVHQAIQEMKLHREMPADAKAKKNNKIAQTKQFQRQEEPQHRADQRFKRAMIAACRSGREHTLFGTVKDRRPFAISRLRAEPGFSIVGSSAEMCASLGSLR